ncbi:ABC transporter permease [Virgibacillus salexigens]|uniref:Putative hemin transport system permease protein HrtB n=1 Tax=Virgibacillus kapii TaxID=1638645 RepID=A0ABQ2DV17_9BACI|nr:ABC transporter permease [Virgibacillus kapii]GGJ72304.1 ABC transporter permease [Virgibacillus kapii]
MFLAIRELLFAKTKYILIGLIMVLTASLIFIISGLAQGLSSDNASAIQDLQADALIIEEGAEGEIGNSFIPADEREKMIEAQGGNNNASTLAIRMMNTTINDADQQIDIALFATERNGILMPDVAEGMFPQKADEVLADATLKQEGVRIGDQLQVEENTSYTVTGFTADQRYSHTPVVFISNDELEQFNAVAVQGEANTDGSYEVITKETALNGIPSYSQEQASLNMMIIFLYVIAAFVLAVFFYVMTLQKREQFGVLKALGAKSMYLIRGLIGQVILLSLISISIAVVVTFGIGALFPADMPFTLELETMLQPAIIIIVVSTIGAIVSLYQVIQIDPIEAIEGAAY